MSFFISSIFFSDLQHFVRCDSPRRSRNPRRNHRRVSRSRESPVQPEQGRLQQGLGDRHLLFQAETVNIDSNI